MANNNRIVYNLDFKANLTDVQGQLDRLRQSLNTISNQRIVNPQASQEIMKAANSASILELSLQKAFNTNTGKLDLTRFDMQIKNMGYSLDNLSMDLLKMGPQGQKAFMEISLAMSNAQQKMFQLNTLAQKFFTTLGNTLRWQVSSMALTTLYSGISKAFNYAKDLNKTLNDIRIVTGDSAEDMDRFTKSASKMAKTVGSTTLEVAKGTLIYRQQGDAADLAAKKAEITAKAANIAFNASADEMSEYLTAIWNSYQVGEENLELFVDKLAIAGATTATNMEELSTAMEKVAATANTVGVSYDQLLATISTVSSATRQSAEQVGTAFKTIYARMGDLKLEGSVEDEDGLSVSLGQVSESLGQIGVHILDANGQIRDMGYIVEELGNKWETLSLNEQTAIAQMVGGKRQYTQVMALFGNWDKYKDTLGEVADAQGALDEQNEIFKESWEGALNSTKVEWEKLVNTLINDDFIIDIIQGFGKIVEEVTDVMEVIDGFKGILLILGGALLRTFGPQISNGLTNMAAGFINMIGLGNKWNQKLLEQNQRTLDNAVAERLLTKAQAEELSIINDLGQATNRFNIEKKKMSEPQAFMMEQDLMNIRRMIEGASNELFNLRQEYQNIFNSGSLHTSDFGFNSRVNNNQIRTLAVELEKVNFNVDIVDGNLRGLNHTITNSFSPEEVVAFADYLNELRNNTRGFEQQLRDTKQQIDNFNQGLNKNYSSQSLKQLKKELQSTQQEAQNTKQQLDSLRTAGSVGSNNGSNHLRFLTNELVNTGGSLSSVKMKFLETQGSTKQWYTALQALSGKLKTNGTDLKSFISRIQELSQKSDLSEKEIKELENAIKQLQEIGKQKLGLSQQITQFASSLMNAQMMITSITSAIRTFGDESASTGDKITAVIYPLTTLLFGLSPAFQAAGTAAAAGANGLAAFWTAAWPLLAITAGVGLVMWLEEVIITADEAKKNIKELDAEFEDLKSQIEENKNKSNTVEDLYKEYEILQDLIKYGKASDEQKNRLIEISNTLVDTYGLEVSGLKDLTGAYNISKQAVDDYVESLRKERIEQEENLKENRDETIKNINALKHSEKKNTLNPRGEDSNLYNGMGFQVDNGNMILDEYYFLQHGFSKDDISKLKKEFNNKKYNQDLLQQLNNAVDEIYSESSKEIDKYNAQIDSKYNSQISAAALDVLEQKTIDILNQEEFNLMGGVIGSYLTNSTGAYAEQLRTDANARESYLENVKSFSEEYQYAIKNITEKNQELIKKMSAGELNNLTDYSSYYNNIMDQQTLIQEAFRNNLIDVETYKIEFEKLSSQIENDIGLRLSKISQDYTGEFDESEKTIFKSFSDDILELKSNLEQGKIDFDDYLSGVSKQISNTNWGDMLKFDELDDNDQITDQFTASMISTFSQIGEQATDAFFSGIKKGKVIGEEDIGELDSLISYYEKLSTSMSGAFDNADMVNDAINNLKSYKEELQSINTIFNKLEKNTYKNAKEMAIDLNKLGVTYNDLKKAGVKSADDLIKSDKNLNKNTALSVSQLQQTLGTGQEAHDNAQKIAIQQQKDNMVKTAISSQIIVDNLVNKIKDTFMGFKLKWDEEKQEFTFEGVGSTPKTTDPSARSAFASAMNIEDDYGLKMAAADYDAKQAFSEVQRTIKNGKLTSEQGTKVLESYYAAKKLGASSSTVGAAGSVAFAFDNDMYNTTLDTGSGKPPEDTGDGDEFELESLIEAKVSDLIDKYRTIQEVMFEALENEGDMLDENIDGWEKIITNQTEQNAMRDVLIDGEKKIQEGLNTLLDELITSTEYSLEEISKWFNSEGEETAYYKALRNAQGSDDAAEALDKVFEDFQAVWQALIESNEKLSEHAKGKIDDIKELREKIVSGAEKVIADYDYEIEKLNQEDFIDYGSIRNLIYAKIKATEDLIRYYLSQGILEDSEIIQGLKQEIWGYEKDLVESYDNEFEQSKKQLDEIYKEIEYQNKKKSEALQDEITQRQKILDLEKKHNSAMKELRQTQRDINKELISSKMSVQWLDKETRELLFNQNDYYKITSKVSEIQSYLNDLYVDYNAKIAALGEDELYLADNITKEYEAQVAAKKEELGILKASLDLEKKRNALNSALSERNVRVFAGGRWRQVANTEAVSKAYQDLMDTQNEIAEKQLENAENSATRQEEAEIRRLEDLKKTYDEQTKMMKEKIEEMEHNWNILNSDLNLAGKSVEELTSMFNIAINEMNLNIEAWSASRNKLKQGDYSGLSNPGYQLTAEQMKAVNDIIWYKGKYDKADTETRKAIEAAVIPLYEKLPSNIIVALKGMGYQEAFDTYKGGQYQATELSYTEKIIDNKKEWEDLERQKLEAIENGQEEQVEKITEQQSKIAKETKYYYNQLSKTNSELAEKLKNSSAETAKTFKNMANTVVSTVQEMKNGVVSNLQKTSTSGGGGGGYSSTSGGGGGGYSSTSGGGGGGGGSPAKSDGTKVYNSNEGGTQVQTVVSPDGTSTTYVKQGGQWTLDNGYLESSGKRSKTGLATGRKDGPAGTFRVNELGIELLATNDGQFIELNPHEKIFNNDQMNFLYDFSRRGMEASSNAISSVSNYNEDSLNIDNITLQLPNVTDTNSFVEGLKGLREHIRNTKTIRRR